MKTKLHYLFPILALLLTGCAVFRPKQTGLLDGKLRPCPPAPKCVSSYYEKGIHHIEPLRASLDQIESVLLNLDEANIVKGETNYLYAEFTSRIFGFVDDVEFLYDPTTGLTHVRSASRVGYGDMGVNRKRIEAIRTAIGG